VSDQVFDILEASMSRRVVPFGSAFPSPLLFPLARLGQFMAASARSLDPWSTVDDLTPGSAALWRQIALRHLADGMQVPADETAGPRPAASHERSRGRSSRAR